MTVMNNQQFQEVLRGCHQIMANPAETGTRKRKARALAEEITRGSGMVASAAGQWADTAESDIKQDLILDVIDA